VTGFEIALPPSLKAEKRGDIAILALSRPEKCNALNNAMIYGIEAFFASLPATIKAVVLSGEGEHFCAGLDLRELTAHNAGQSIAHSRSWHRAFERIEAGKVPVVAVLHGAVIGGGLEIAAACHIRVAENTAYYALPEASRGIFTGGGGAVRLPRLIGTARMTDMMLTARTLSAEEGQDAGLSQYLVPPGAGEAKAIELAECIASNPPLANFAITQVLPQIAESGSASGYLTEALMAAVTQSSEDAKQRLQAFLEKRAPKTVRN
jgi:enoyl-CoA hydratase/carnithine racemase